MAKSTKNITKKAIQEMINDQLDPLIAEIQNLKKEREIQLALNCHLESKLSLLARRVDDGEQYVKRQNFIIDGVPLKRGETPDTIHKFVLQEIHKLGLDIDDYELDRAHRIDSPYDDGWGRKQPVIARFTSWSSRNLMYQARKKSRFWCSADLTPRRQAILEKARKMIDELEHVGSCIDYAFVDKNCILQAHSRDGRLFGFSSVLEFAELPAYIDNTSQPRNRPHPGFEHMYDRTFYTNSDNIVHPKLPESLEKVLQRLQAATAPIDPNEACHDMSANEVSHVTSVHDQSDISSLTASPPTSPVKQVL